ncbi:MAG: DEAD/DEAH box helicase family protein [Candidatus Thermoplasmatota archaeon]|nr:DEAD/DEAH box helicase family protein [Candidatus Thermoplasmatota archaeon]
MDDFNFRRGQKEATEDIAKLFRDGNEVVLLNSPTGSGKSLICLLTADAGMGAYYLTPQVLLVDQIGNDLTGRYGRFNFSASIIKGRKNYLCIYGIRVEGNDDATCAGAACTQGRKDPEFLEEEWKCSFDAECHYNRAKRKALASSIVVSTTDFALNGIFPSQRWPRKRLLIIDEADNIVSDFISFYSIELTDTGLYGFDFQEFISGISEQVRAVDAIIKEVPDKRDYQKLFTTSWKGLELLKKAMTSYRSTIEHELSQLSVHGHDDPELAMTIATSRDRCLRMLMLLNNAGQTSWIMKPKRNGGRVVAVVWSPLSLQPFSNLVWRGFDHILLSSATFVDPQRMLADLGLGNRKWTMITVPDTFPARRAPVVLANVVKLSSMHDFDRSMLKVMSFIEKICCAVYGSIRVRGLIHCNSYLIQKYILSHASPGLQSRLVGHGRGRSRNITLEEWKTSGAEASVFCAVGMNRGIDLPYDLCRYQIIVKGPFADLGDGFTSARKASLGEMGQQWYITEMLKEVIQASGRGMRHSDDACVTYIVDSIVCRAIRNPSYWPLLPEWFRARVTAGDVVIAFERKEVLKNLRTAHGKCEVNK